MMRVGIAADHGGFALKGQVLESLRGAGYDTVDFGAHELNLGDDYPDFIIPLARAVAAGKVERGIALCGSGVGASIAANKVGGVRAGLIQDVFSAHQGVEDDDMNVFCLGGKVIGPALAWELIRTFLAAHFSGAPRHLRRLAEVQALEKQEDAAQGTAGRNDESDRKTSQHRPEPLARQHHTGSAHQWDTCPLYQGALGNGPHLESHDLRSRH